ncbi:hypothetical protein LJR234_005636 [Mesorhizobium amorphae]|uniref:hypothetical protein n=1 Tax=Mesorhizobium amorphae TaxID=71433 RepID=UPI003ECF74CD
MIVVIAVSILGNGPGNGLKKQMAARTFRCGHPIFHAHAFEQAAVSEPTTKWSCSSACSWRIPIAAIERPRNWIQ